MLRRPDQRQELFLQEQHEERPPAPAPAQEQQQQHHHHNNLHRHQIFQKGVGAGGGFLHRRPVPRDGSNSIEPMEMIREEIAIMKKLHHPNLVTLIEVLDEPGQDSLYMVMDLCKNGVVMHVGLDHTADPYGVDQCREWFRSMILGVEYRKYR